MVQANKRVFILYCALLMILCFYLIGCEDKTIIGIPSSYDDKYPYPYDLNASWSSDYNLLIYYNADHSDENGVVTDSTYGIYIKDLSSDSTTIWSVNNMIGGSGLSLSPDKQWLIFESVYNIYKIPFENPFDESKIEMIGSDTGPNLFPKWSRNGDLIAVDIRLGDPGIYIMEGDGSDKHKVGPWGGRHPFFTIDNEYIYCSGYPGSGENWEIFKINYSENTYTQITFFNEFNHINYVLPSFDENILIFSARHIDDWGTYIYRYDINADEFIRLIDKYAEAWDWNYEDDTILYTYCPSIEQGDVNGFLWTMKPDGTDKNQITFIE